MRSRQSSYLSKNEEGLLSNAQLKALLKAGCDKDARFRLQATGFSMSPFIRNGDVVTVATRSTIRFGDVIALAHPHIDRVLIHRIVGLNTTHVLTRGDNAGTPDGWIPYRRVLGRVEQIEKPDGRKVWGLGPERIMIAILTRTGLLPSVGQPLWNVCKRLKGRHCDAASHRST